MRTNSARVELAEEYLGLANDAIVSDSYAIARKSVAHSLSLAAKARDAELGRTTRARTKDVEEIATAYEQLDAERRDLLSDETDLVANMAVGRFLCLYKTDWKRGLTHLAKGSDADWNAIAKLELSEPGDAEGMARAGDHWWTVSMSEKGLALRNARSRVNFWYWKALPDLGGLREKLVENRLATDLAARIDASNLRQDALLLLTFEKNTLRRQQQSLYLADSSEIRARGLARGFSDAKLRPGIVGEAMDFDGNNDHILFPELHDELTSNLTGVAITTWVKVSDKSAGWIFDVGFFAEKSLSMGHSDGSWWFNVPKEQGGHTSVSGVDSQWHHLACVWDGREKRIYVDAVAVRIEGALRGPLSGATFSRNPARIGGQAKSDRQSKRYFRGYLDEFGVFGRALSEDEVRLTYLLDRTGVSLTEKR